MSIKFLNGIDVDNGVLYTDTSNNRVGINTSSPQVPLEAKYTGTTDEILRIVGAASGKPQMTFYNDSTLHTKIVAAGNNDFSITNTHSTGDMFFGTGGATRLHIEANGNVGIGTINPSVTLHVNGWTRVNGGLQLDGSNRQVMAIDNTSLLLGTNNTERMRIDASGNVGIGTTNPQRKLEVVGKIRVSDIIEWGWGGVGIIGSTTTNDVRIKTWNGSFPEDRLIVNGSGNVGIGTTSPGVKLEVNGGNDNEIAKFLSTDDTAQISISDNDTDGFFGVKNGVAFISQTAGTPVSGIAVDSSGNVGIGTISPSEKLEVVGAIKMSQNASYPLTIKHNSGTSTNQIDAVGGLDVICSSNNTISFKDSTTTNMTISGYSGDVIMGYNTGKVGIGTASPTDKLTVENGNIRLNSTSSYPSQGLSAYWNNNSPNMGGISWHQNPGFVGSEWYHNKQSSPYTQARIRLIGDASGQMNVNLNNSQVFTILASNGGVGIANTNPTGLLVVGAGTSNTGHRSNTLLSEEATGSTANSLGLVNSSLGAYGNETALNFHLSRTYSPTARIIAYQDGSSSMTDTGLKFFTYNGSLQQRMTIDHDGDVGIGTASPSEKLEVNGHIKAVDGYKGYVSHFHSGGFDHFPRSGDAANPMWIPTNYIVDASTDQYYNVWVPLYAGRIRKIILKNITGTPTATVCTFRKKINGVLSGTTYAGTVTGGGAAGMKVTFDFGTTNFTFNAEDEVQIGIVTGVAQQPPMRGVSYQIWYEYNIT